MEKTKRFYNKAGLLASLMVISTSNLLADNNATSTSTSTSTSPSPMGAFKSTLTTEMESYLIPLIMIVVIIASVIAYSKTKDWTTTLTIGGISAAILGGASSLVTLFSAVNFGGE